MARDYKSVVKALLLKAQATEFEPEREELENRAYKLMSEHQIEVALEKEVTDQQIIRKNRFANPYALQKWALYNILADHFNSRTIRMGDGLVYFFGYESDFQSTEFMYSLLINQAFKMLSEVKISQGINARTYKVSWWSGFNSRISARLRESKKAATDEAVPGAAVALYDRARASEREMRKMAPRISRVKSNVRSSSAYYSGQDAGNNAQFHGQSEVTKNGPRALF